MPDNNQSPAGRKSERVLLRIPIRVEGKDTLGDAFDETTYTLIVNQSGGLIVVSHPLQPGDVIKITNLRNRISCSFQVVMRAAKSFSGTPEWGVKCLQPEAEIWGVHFPTRTEEPSQTDLVHVLLECQGCLSREMATLSVLQYRRLVAQSSLPRPCPKCSATRDWKFGFIEIEIEEVLTSVLAPSVSGVTPPRVVEKRQDKRMAVKLPLGVRLPDGSEETSTTENISRSGLCFACNLEMNVGDRVYVSVGGGAPSEERDIPARIMWRRPAKDRGRALYGVKFEGGA
jgi:hypothetical protein